MTKPKLRMSVALWGRTSAKRKRAWSGGRLDASRLGKRQGVSPLRWRSLSARQFGAFLMPDRASGDSEHDEVARQPAEGQPDQPSRPLRSPSQSRFGFVLFEQPDQPEVGDPHATALVDQNVLRLDVAMHDPTS